MSSQYRNPFTPPEGVILTPTEFLQLKLDFSLWDVRNPVVHNTTCSDSEHTSLLNAGLCCVDYLRSIIEATMLALAGCRAGVFEEPPGFRNWLTLANVRLLALKSGIDDVPGWKIILDVRHNSLYEWIWSYTDGNDLTLRPIFSLHGFRMLCRRHGFAPRLGVVAEVFNNDLDHVTEFWARPE